MAAKIDLYAGLLGCGKTSLIGKLLQTEYAGKKVAVIENEIGKINLDAEVLENPRIQITSITSGCICCTLHGDFVQAIELLIETKSPDYILIEPTGVADIRGLLKAIEPIPTASLHRCVLVLNAKKIRTMLTVVGPFFTEQVRTASCLYLNFTETMSPEDIHDVVQTLEAIHPHASIVTTPLEKISSNTFCGISQDFVCSLAPEHSKIRIFSLDEGNDKQDRTKKIQVRSQNDITLYAYTLNLPKPLSKDQLISLHKLLLDPVCGEIWRVKGIVLRQDGEKEKIDLTFGDVYQTEFVSDTHEIDGKITLIGPRIQKKQIRQQLQEFYED